MSISTKEKNVSAFNQDVAASGGYSYTDPSRYSSRVANQRLSEAIAQVVDVRGKTVLDVGCGDGHYTLELAALRPKELVAVDAADTAIAFARTRPLPHASATPVQFLAMDVYELGKIGRRFDVAVVRGLLHHLYTPEKAIAALTQIADQVVVVEPNGYNPVLKVIERVSTYHREHEEKSYAPHRLDGWFHQQNWTIRQGLYAGLVPMFCPEWFARICKFFEPWVEKIPGLRQISCAVYVFRAEPRR